MMRPLLIDVLRLAAPFCMAMAAFALGRLLHRFAKLIRIGLIVLCVLVIVVTGTSIAGWTPARLDQWIGLLCGPITILSCAALFLFGIVWSVPGRSISSTFLAILCVVALALVLIENCGSLWWRFAAPQTWRNTVDLQGRILQSSSLTCEPAAAAMLLHRYGVDASEGEMAYWAGTSFFGTDAFSIGTALDRKLIGKNLRSLVRKTDYETSLREGTPFIAHVDGSGVGHAVLVEDIQPDRVALIDPADGRAKQRSRKEFERIWDGTAIHIVPE